eukprot:Skav201203  [mRNA]  locus=scaffold633:609475:612369:- [translate_table: standard]
MLPPIDSHSGYNGSHRRLRYCFLASPDKLPKAKSGIDFNPAVAASAALPALTMLAEDAEAKYGDNRKWPGKLRATAGLEEAWERAKPAGSATLSPVVHCLKYGNLQPIIFSSHEIAGCEGTVTVKDKLAKLSKQNAPHWATEMQPDVTETGFRS